MTASDGITATDTEGKWPVSESGRCQQSGWCQSESGRRCQSGEVAGRCQSDEWPVSEGKWPVSEWPAGVSREWPVSERGSGRRVSE